MAKFQCNFISYTLMRSVDITVIIPSPAMPEALIKNLTLPLPERMAVPGASDEILESGVLGEIAYPTHTKENKYPVLYLLHGMGNNHATWTGYTNIELFAEERNIAVVMISAENKSYVRHECGEDFYRFLEEEIPDFVKGMFPVSDRKEDTYLAGLSMGGFGTLVHGLSHPEKYQAIGVFSPAVSLNPSQLAGTGKYPKQKKYDPYALVDSLLEAKKEFPIIYVACGEDDLLYSESKDFVDYLKSHEINVTWNSVPGYSHEWRFWNEVVEMFLDFIPRTDYYSMKGKRQI